MCLNMSFATKKSKTCNLLALLNYFYFYFFLLQLLPTILHAHLWFAPSTIYSRLPLLAFVLHFLRLAPTTTNNCCASLNFVYLLLLHLLLWLSTTCSRPLLFVVARYYATCTCLEPLYEIHFTC